MSEILEFVQYRLSIYTLFASLALPFAYFAIQARYPANSIPQKKAQALLLLVAATTAAYILAHIPFFIGESIEYRMLAFMHLAPPVLCFLIVSHVRSVKSGQQTPSLQNSQPVLEAMTRSVDKSLPDFDSRMNIIEREVRQIRGIPGIDCDYLADISDGFTVKEISLIMRQAHALSLEFDEEEEAGELDGKTRAEYFEDTFAELASESRESLRSANS